MSEIGTLNEKPLHAALKAHYARPGDQTEVKVDGFFIDIVQGELLIEIQTGNFASIKSKLTRLTQDRRVHLVYPIAYEKWIVKLTSEGTSRRKSPKRGRVEELFVEMVRIPHLMMSSNFSLEVVMTKEEELRRYKPNLNWRRRGWGIVERRLLEVVDQIAFEEPADWLALLPEDLDEFTTKDLAGKLGISQHLARKMAYCLRKADLIKLVGKRGRANLFQCNP